MKRYNLFAVLLAVVSIVALPVRGASRDSAIADRLESLTAGPTSSVMAAERQVEVKTGTSGAVLTITPSSGPDLVNSAAAANTREVYEDCFIALFLKIENIGTEAAPASTAVLWLSTDGDFDVTDDEQLTTLPVPALDPGDETWIATRTHIAKGLNTPIDVWLACLVDAGDEIVEDSENNLFVTTEPLFRIVEPPAQQQNVVYDYTFRGNIYSNGSRVLTGQGAMVIDQVTGAVTDMCKYSNGSAYIERWDLYGMSYECTPHSGGYLFLVNDDQTSLLGSEDEYFHITQFYGAHHPSTVPLGGAASGTVCATLVGQSRFGGESGGTACYGMGSISGRINLAETRQANAENKPHSELARDVANRLGVPLQVTGDDSDLAEVLEDVPPKQESPGTASTPPWMLYTLSMSGVAAGDELIDPKSYGGYMLIDHSTGLIVAIPMWVENGQGYFDLVNWSGMQPINYQLPLGGGYHFFGGIDRIFYVSGARAAYFWIGYGPDFRHNFGTGQQWSLPISLTGETWRNMDMSAGHEYKQLSMNAKVHLGTLELNGPYPAERMDAMGALYFIVENLIPANFELAE